MGKQKYQKQIEELLKKSPVVSYNSIERVVNNKKKVSQYSKQLVRNLILNGKLKKLAKGFYTIHDDPSLVVFCLNPSYLGLQDSLSQNSLWEQETIPVVITSRKVRQGLRKINGSNVLIRTIKKEYVFGIDYKKSGSFYLPYSDVEKTLIDMVYFKQKMSKEVLSSIKKKINKIKLFLYLKKYPKKMRLRIIKQVE
ncbi:MAG: hypothetical protein ABIH28_02185 [archaeon]